MASAIRSCAGGVVFYGEQVFLLFDDHGEWVMPKVFHPSDLDLPTEEPSEPEEYQPLPVWPIVEPEVPEDLPPHGEIAKS